MKESGIPFTILQNGIYLEMILAFIGDKVLETGTLFFPAGNGKASYVLREDLAEAAAQVLVTSGHENKVYQLNNVTSVSFADIADAISDVAENNVAYLSPSVEEFKLAMNKRGVPEMYIGMFVMWAVAIAQGTMDAAEQSLQHLIGRKPTSMPEFIHKMYKSKQA